MHFRNIPVDRDLKAKLVLMFSFIYWASTNHSCQHRNHSYRHNILKVPLLASVDILAQILRTEEKQIMSLSLNTTVKEDIQIKQYYWDDTWRLHYKHWTGWQNILCRDFFNYSHSFILRRHWTAVVLLGVLKYSADKMGEGALSHINVCLIHTACIFTNAPQHQQTHFLMYILWRIFKARGKGLLSLWHLYSC